MNSPTNWLITNAGQGAAGLWVWSWQAMVLLACVLLGLKIRRAKAPALRHQVWLFGLVAVAALPLCAKLAQRFPTLQSGEGRLLNAPVMSYVLEAPRVVVEAEPLSAANESPAAKPPAPTAKTSIFLPLLFTIWLFGALFMTARLLMSCVRLRRVREGAAAVRPGDLGYADTYAESILKVAERSVAADLAFNGRHQLAFISNKQMLKRRIEMILNDNRARLVAKQRKFLLLAAGLIAFVVWMLIPGSNEKSGLAQHQAVKGAPKPVDTLPLKAQAVKDIGERHGYDGLVQTALTDPELSRDALSRLIFFDRDKNTGALVKLYQQSSDPIVKEIIIHSLGRRIEVAPLTAISQTDPSPEFRQLASSTLKWLQESGGANELKLREELNNQARLSRRDDPPPPPPPSKASMAVSSDSEPQPRSDQPFNPPAFTLLREIVYAQLRRDPAVLERILADDYIGTDSTGAVYDRTQEISVGRGFDYAARRFEFDNCGISGDGEISIARVLGSVYSQAGVEPIAQYRYNITFGRRRGQMKVVAIHMDRKQ